MYFPIGWPKAVNLSLPNGSSHVNHICCDAVKILLAVVGDDFLGIWYANPLIPITFFRRSMQSVDTIGTNSFIVWKPDSRKLAVLTSNGLLILYQVDFDLNAKGGVLTQVDPPNRNLKRESAELFIKENIPRLNIKELCVVSMESSISTLCCISFSELIIATEDCKLIKILWDELEKGVSNNRIIDLHSIQFYMNHQSNVKSIPTITQRFVTSIEYSPFIGGCAIIFSDHCAAFLITVHMRFEEQRIHGFWAPDVDDATISCVNHKFRLLAYGRRNSEVNVYAIEDTTGGLKLSHTLSLDSRVIPGGPGPVNDLKWTPDGCVVAVSWTNGGFSLWTTFGVLLTTSLNWDFNIHTDLVQKNPLKINKMEWSTEGYQLYLSCSKKNVTEFQMSNVLVLNFVKSALTMNPCMTSTPHILLQGDDTLYFNLGDHLENIYFASNLSFPNINKSFRDNDIGDNNNMEINDTTDGSRILSESKFWNILQLPLAYVASNWPIRYSAIDFRGFHVAVAGRTGLAHYSMLTKKWKLFGNESQEKDFVVSGGLMWWRGFIILGCYSLLDRIDEIRCYPEESKLDNEFGKKIQVRAPVITVNMFKDQLIVLTADGCVTIFMLTKYNAFSLSMVCAYEVDVKSICIHPACITSLTVMNLKSNTATKPNQVNETIIVNVCGRILMIQHDLRNNVVNSIMASCLASCVEIFWVSSAYERNDMRDCLWLFSGAQGMRVWLPILPLGNEEERDASHRLHTFMSKRIMLSFPLKLYPLAIRFENVIIIGVENDSTLYLSEWKSIFSLPFCLLDRKSQIYLHKILRELIKRNIGYSAWEIAKCYRTLPYFPHTLELLLHEVLEEEATSKDPIPDALLPSILDFIREFPVYMQTIVQCARKTEIALWPHLFSKAGKPKDLFQQCLHCGDLEIASSYLIILQNLEPPTVSKQYATVLLDLSLQNRKWELAKDLMRFLRAIDPNEIDSPSSSTVINMKIAPPAHNKTVVNQNPEVLNLILGPIARERSFSTTTLTNSSKVSLVGSGTCTGASNPGVQLAPRCRSEQNNSLSGLMETFFIETILQRHAFTLLQKFKLIDLGYMSAILDFHLVNWLSQEREDALEILDFVPTLHILHRQLELIPLLLNHPFQDEFRMNVVSKSEVDIKNIHFDMSHMLRESSQTSESGYFSVALAEAQLSPNEEIGGHYRTNLSENRDIAFRSRSNSEVSFDNQKYRSYTSHPVSVALDSIQNASEYDSKLLPENLAVKIRYLLQLFIEANCVDYALLLSILLQDASSIGRIINTLIRSRSLATCHRMESAMLNFVNWCTENHCVYQAFAMSLHPHLYLLHRFLRPTSNAYGPNHYVKISTPLSSGSEVVDDIVNVSQKNARISQAGRAVEKYDHDQQNTSCDPKYSAKKNHTNIPPNMRTRKKSASSDGTASNKQSECNIM